MDLWNIDTEKDFFKKALKDFSSKEKIFYLLDNDYFAYIPKEHDGNVATLQSRNSLIGQFTEKWTKDIFEFIAKKFSLYAVNGIICEEIALTKRSSGDLALTTKNSIYQKIEDIKIIFEIKMSIVSNYKFIDEDNFQYLGNYKTHKGVPSLLRSDSMLKAIGKAVNIRVSSLKSSKIPIIVLGNSPIQDSYIKKVDFLKNTGLIQGFWSLNPNPLNDYNYIKNSPKMGFLTIKTIDDLYIQIKELLSNDFNYFSSMSSKEELGKIIFIASQEKTDEERAVKFLSLIREE